MLWPITLLVIDQAPWGARSPFGLDRFRQKAWYFLEKNARHIAILKPRRDEPLTPADLPEIERIFLQAGVAESEDLDRLRPDGGLEGLGRSPDEVHGSSVGRAEA